MLTTAPRPSRLCRTSNGYAAGHRQESFVRRHAACVTALVTLIPFTVALPSPAQDQAAADLVRFDDCGAFLDHVKKEALARVGPYGLGAGRS